MLRFAALAVCGVTLILSAPAFSNDRYGQDPAVMVSPDLSAPWVMQLKRPPKRLQQRALPGSLSPRETLVIGATISRKQMRVLPNQPTYNAGVRVLRSERALPDPLQQVAYNGVPRKITREQTHEIDPMFLPQQVEYSGSEPAGTIVIDTSSKFLYFVEGNGQARRYGVGVGKEGFLWHGTQKITRKTEWPSWTPPEEMKVRVRLKEGRILPDRMEGGPENPLGARAMYLGSTLYRIHGTNQPWTIGSNVSSGCIRMRNEDVVDLYERVGVGTKVIVHG